MQIFLVRHTPVVLPLGTCYGHTDVALAAGWPARFRRLRRKLPDAALREGAVYSSPLQRCLQLARFLSSEVRVDDRLRELHFGRWEGLRWDAIPPEEMRLWASDYANAAVPGGESYGQLYARAGACYDEILAGGTPAAIVVTHGGVILALLARLLDIPLASSFRLRVDYGSVTAIDVQGEQVRIGYINR